MSGVGLPFGVTKYSGRFLNSIVIVLFTVLTYFSFSSCQELSRDIGALCTEDADCAENEFCFEDGCFDGCESDLSCQPDFQCQSLYRLQGGRVDVCAPGEPDSDKCQSDADCVEKLMVSNAKCSIDELCFVPKELFSILIRDTSDPDLSGMDGRDGSDIIGVYLTIDDKIVAHGTTLLAKTADGGTIESPIKGGPPSLDVAGTCIDGDFENDSLHLGIGGIALVRFLDTRFNDYVEEPSTWEVNVIEWGTNCGIADDRDRYEVLLCTSSSYENVDFDRECVQIGNGDGFSKFKTKKL